MSDKIRPEQSDLRRLMRDSAEQAHDFDPRDPMVGLTSRDLSGPVLERRTVLRLLAASGALTAVHLMPGLGVSPANAATGGTLREIATRAAPARPRGSTVRRAPFHAQPIEPPSPLPGRNRV